VRPRKLIEAPRQLTHLVVRPSGEDLGKPAPPVFGGAETTGTAVGDVVLDVTTIVIDDAWRLEESTHRHQRRVERL